MFSAKRAIFTLAMQRRRDLCDVPLMLGGILECGGKRSATPLCLAQLRGNRESLHALAPEDHTSAKKAPWPLRFAGAVQNGGLMTRQPKLLSPCHRINKEALLALKTYKGGSLFAGQAGGPSSLCAIRAVRSRTKKQE